MLKKLALFCLSLLMCLSVVAGLVYASEGADPSDPPAPTESVDPKKPVDPEDPEKPENPGDPGVKPQGDVSIPDPPPEGLPVE